MRLLTLVFIGRDDFDLPVYKCAGRLYVDVSPRKDKPPTICTKYKNEFYGEPDTPIKENIEIVFVPYRDVWRF